uniref:MoaD/ThiS family protein n=1 Tax=Geoglobus ahangari TaxID=113653 RepID=A0A7C4S4Z7_9EURY
MVRLRRLGSGGHTEVEIPLEVAVSEILKHIMTGGIAVTQEGMKISTENIEKIKDSDKILLIPKISGG